MTQDITSLIEKLEGSEGPSQELSARVIHAVRAPDGSVEQSRLNGRWCVYDKNGRLLENDSRNGWWRESGWGATESLDAALALAERVLGGAFRLGLIQQPNGSWEAATLWTDEAEDRDVQFGDAATPALALCAAILRAQSEAR